MLRYSLPEFLVFAACFLAASLSAQSRFQTDSGNIHFVSEAPLELIEAETDRFKMIVDTVESAFAVTVLIENFQGFNSPLQQEHFYENYMETHQFPKAVFSGKILSPMNVENAVFEVQVRGKLTIHGVAVSRIITAQCAWDEKGNLTVSSEFTVPLEAHHIEIPRIVYRKIAEEITVTVNAELTPME